MDAESSLSRALGSDPTVVDGETRAAIEADAGLRLDDVSPELVAFVVDRSRKAGNVAFKNKEFTRAVEFYCQAIAGDATDFTLFGNRSAAYLALGRPKDALLDASKSILLSKNKGNATSPHGRPRIREPRAEKVPPLRRKERTREGGQGGEGRGHRAAHSTPDA